MAFGKMGARGGFGSLGVLGRASIYPAGATVFADWINSRYLNAAQTFARNSAATKASAAHLYASVSANVLRQTVDLIGGNALGAFIEDAATNGIRNATFAGLVAGTVGSGGSYPTNFQTTNSISGLSATVATATVNGQPGMQVRLQGTFGSSGAYYLQFESTTGLTVTVGDTWETQVDYAMVAGSVASVVSIEYGYIERNSSGTFQNQKNTGKVNLGLLGSYVQSGYTSATVTAGARICPYISVAGSSGTSIDITLVIGNISCVKVSKPTSPIYSNGSALARAADDLSISLPSLGSTASYMIAGEPRQASDGRTFAHLVDGSSNGLRFYRSAFDLYAVSAVAGVEGTPVNLGRCMSGAGIKVLAAVSGSSISVSYNGKPSVSVTDGAAYTTAYLGEKSDKSNQWGGTVSTFQAGPGAPSWSSALSTIFDDFERADGAIGTSPSGLAWSQVTGGAQIATAVISSNALIVAADSGQAFTASYNGVTLGSTVQEMRALLSFGSGTANNGNVTLISNPNGVTSVNNVTDKSVHIVFTDTKVDVGVWISGVNTIISTINYASVLAHDGTQYQVGWELDGSTIVIYMPDGSTQVVTDTTGQNRFQTCGGQYAIFEIFWTGAAAARASILAAYART